MLDFLSDRSIQKPIPLPHPLGVPALPADAQRPWRSFRAHFENNSRRPLPDVSVDRFPEDDQRRPQALAAILARFQLGEAGEGRVARQIDHVALTAVDDDYRVALKLFVKEEGRHARTLGAIVKGLGGQLLRAKASNHLFLRARRFLGVRFKILVLLIAEVVGGALYEALAPHLRPGKARAALREIAGDEQAHLEFHAAFLTLQPWVWRQTLRAAYWVVGFCAIAVVVTENFLDLVRLGLAPGQIVARLVADLRTADRKAFAAAAPCRTLAGGLS